jgi:hypothetical protein
MTPGQRPRAAARPALDQLRASVAEIGDGTCVEFATSRRTGNIEITLSAETARSMKTDLIDVSPTGSAPRTMAAGLRPRSHAAMPEATGDFCNDLHTFDAHMPETAKDATIEDLMAGAGKEPQVARRVSAPLEHGGVDVHLAQIIEAWPELPVKTRAAMVALLNDCDGGEGSTRGLAGRPSALRPVRAKDAGDAKRRGSRKSGSPSS